MSRPPKSHDNTAVAAFLEPYCFAREACAAYPWLDDIFVGIFGAKTEGDTSARSLSRKTLFHILQRCPVITAEAVSRAMGDNTAPRTARAYALAARAASLFIAKFIDNLPEDQEPGVMATLIKEPMDTSIGYLQGWFLRHGP